MTESHAWWLGEVLWMVLQPGLQLLPRGLPQGGKILGKEVHLLCHPAFDDGVALIESHRDGFAVEHLFADLRVDQALEFLRRGIGQALGPLGYDQLQQVVIGKDDPFRILLSVPRPSHRLMAKIAAPIRAKCRNGSRSQRRKMDVACGSICT